MNTLLSIISPHSSPLNVQFYLMLVACLVCLVFCYLLMTNRILQSFNLRGLLGMLFGFIGFVALGATVLTFVHAQNITPISFENRKVSFASETIPFKDIRKHYIKPLIQQSRYSAQISTDTSMVYVIETADKSVHLFSNAYYDMLEMQKAFDTELKTPK